MSGFTRHWLAAVSVAAGAWISTPAQQCVVGQAQPAGLPQGSGLAAKYPGDRGLERDPHVLFTEGFEGGAIPTVGDEQAGGFYDLKGYPETMYITDREAAVGKRSLELVHPAGVVSPQWLHRKFPGRDTVYVRFYRKFAKDWAWAPLGIHDTYLFAGRYDTPAATDLTLYLDVSGVDQRWSTRNAIRETVLSKQPVLVLKSSFQGPGLDFGIRREIISHVGWDNYYLLPFNANRAPVLEGGRWYCFEYMAKMNSAPDRKDGEVRLWVDGRLITEMMGLLLRDAGHQDILWDHWMLGPRYGGQDYKVGPPREQKSWIDGIVVSTRYVGPATTDSKWAAEGGRDRDAGLPGMRGFAGEQHPPIRFQHTIMDPAVYGDCKALGDINGDGLADVVVAGKQLVWYAWPDWRKTILTEAKQEFTTDMQLADVDGDGALDILVPDGEQGEVCWYENPCPKGDPAKTPWKRHVIGEQGAWVHDVQVGFLTGGHTLYVVTRTKDGPTILWRRISPDRWTRRIVEEAPQGEGMALADINRDNRLDIVENGCWLECPQDPMKGTWIRHDFVTGRPSLEKVAVGDINGDGRPDVVLAPSESEGRLAWYEAPADPEHDAWKEHVVDPRVSFVHSLRIVDVDDNGRADIVFAEMAQSATKRVGFYRNGGRGQSWTLQVLATTGSHNLCVGRIGRQGRLALVGCNWQGPPVEIWTRSD